MALKTKWIATVDGHWIDLKSGVNYPFFVGDFYTGPTPEKYAALGILVPAPAGSSQPGNEDEGGTE